MQPGITKLCYQNSLTEVFCGQFLTIANCIAFENCPQNNSIWFAEEVSNPVQLNSTTQPPDTRETKPVNLRSKLGNFKSTAYYKRIFFPRVSKSK